MEVEVIGPSFEHVRKPFSNLEVVADFTYHVATGELVALVGPSGCGKSTLLPTAAGLEQPTWGLGRRAARAQAWARSHADVPGERPLGKQQLAYAGETADMSGVMAGILCIALLATLIDRLLLEGIKRRVLRYQYV